MHRFRLMRLYVLGITILLAVIVAVVAVMRTQADAP
jgi:hypothetical protein